MQITIDTERDDLPAVVRMLEAYAGAPHAKALTSVGPELLSDEAYQLITDAIGVATGIPPRMIRAEGGTPEDQARYVAGLQDTTICHEGSGEPIAKAVGAVSYSEEPIDIGEHAASELDQYPEAASLFDNIGEGKEFAKGFAELAGEAQEVQPEAPKPATRELDSAGHRHDSRIHASTKTKVADGTWKRKRGVEPELVKTVLAGLCGSAEPAVTCSSSPTPPAAPFVPPPPPPPIATAITYQDVLNYMITSKGAVTVAQIQEACQAEGLTSFPELGKCPEKAPAVARRIGMI